MNDQFQELFTRKNIISLLVLAILVLAIPLGVRLIEERAILTGKAAVADLNFTGPNVIPSSPIPIALSADVGVILTPPWPPESGGGPNPTATPSASILVDWGSSCGGSFNANVAVVGITHQDDNDPNVIDLNWDYEKNQPKKSKSGKNLPNAFRYVGAKVTLSDVPKVTTAVTGQQCFKSKFGTNVFKDRCGIKARFVGLPKGKKTATLEVPDGYKMAPNSNRTYSPNTENCGGESAGTKDKFFTGGDKDAVSWKIEPI